MLMQEFAMANPGPVFTNCYGPQSTYLWLVPALPIVAAGVIALLILMHDPWPALVGVGIVLCGIPLRRLFLPRRDVASLVSEISERSS